MAGKYRLIDIPISNCINSGIYRIAVLTQFNSVSLHRHITQTYIFDAFHTGWVQIWAAEQTMSNADWYQGTADAVRKQLFEIKSTRAPYVLILAGDHLYRMDYAAMASFHWEKERRYHRGRPAGCRRRSEPVWACSRRDADCRITRFCRKTQRLRPCCKKWSAVTIEQRPYLGSMGIYMFKTKAVDRSPGKQELRRFWWAGDSHTRSTATTYLVMILTVSGKISGPSARFYETNLALTRPNPPFNLFDPDLPIYTHSRFLPGSVIENSILEHVLIAEGCCIENAEIRHSVVGLRSQIQSGTRIFNTVLMGADYYDRPIDDVDGIPSFLPIGIGRNCQIEGAIIDKNACLGDNVVIKPFPRGTEIETENWVVQDGIVVIPKNSVLPAGTVIAPE